MSGLDRKRPQDWPSGIVERTHRVGGLEATFKARDVNVELETKKGPTGNAVSRAALWSTDPKNPGAYFLAIDFKTTIGLGETLRSAPTDVLYKMRDLIELLLAERTDAKK